MSEVFPLVASYSPPGATPRLRTNGGPDAACTWERWQPTLLKLITVDTPYRKDSQ